MHQVRLVFPFVWMSKADVITRAALFQIPADLTYSCYKGGRNHCGVCPTCVERINAFAGAGYADPVEYDKDVTEKFLNLELWPKEYLPSWNA